MLVINPDPCIDCGVCIPECPVDAITEDFNDDPDGKWLAINLKYSKLWPQITKSRDAPADAEKYESETGKFEKYFSEAPGKGDMQLDSNGCPLSTPSCQRLITPQ